MNSPTYIKAYQAAELVGISVETLRRKYVYMPGSPFFKRGQIFVDKEKFLAWWASVK